MQRSPTPEAGPDPRSVRNPATQQAVSGRPGSEALLPLLPELCLPTPQSVEKLSFTKLVPGATKVGDHCARALVLKSECTLESLQKLENNAVAWVPPPSV